MKKERPSLIYLLVFSLILTLILTSCGSKKPGRTGSDQPSKSSSEQAKAPEKAKDNYLLSQPEKKTQPQLPKELGEGATKEEEEAQNKAYDQYQAFVIAYQKKAQKVQYKDAVYEYTGKLNQVLLKDKEKTVLYSPINTYMAGSMLAETAKGDTQKEILGLLGAENIEKNRTYAKEMRQIVPFDDGRLKITTADSLWLNKGLEIHDECIKRLKEIYGAAVYQGPMGEEGYNKALQAWLNENTGNLLKDQAGEQKFEEDNVYALASALYFKGAWDQSFEENLTKEDIFHGTQGDQTLPFMHSTESREVFTGNGYDAIALPFQGGASLWIIRPKEGKTIDDLLNNEEVFSMIKNPMEDEKKEQFQVNLSLPKFDITSDLSLKDSFQSLGIKKAFDSNQADFSSLLVNWNQVYLSGITHACRLKIDEKGAEAAAFTLMKMDMAALPMNESYEFKVDQPFLAVLTGMDNTPLVFARVNQLK